VRVRKRFSLPVLCVLLLSILTTSSVSLWLVDRFDAGDPIIDERPNAPIETRPPPTTVPQEAPYAALATVIPEDLEGYSVDTGAKATGTLDINAAVAAESDQQAERALLETRHFEAGYARAFTNGEVDAYMAVYDFRNADDARLYAQDGIINLTGKGAGIYEIAEIPGAQGFSQSTNADTRPAVVHGVVFAKGDRFVLVLTRSPSTTTPDKAKELALTLNARA
jgi:hypothetical protein